MIEEEILDLEDSFAGSHIDSVCEKASSMAARRSRPVRFTFNGTAVLCQVGESAKTLRERWDHDYEAAAKAYRESPECKAAEERREKERQEMLVRHLAEPATTESDLRSATVPWPWTIEQLIEYINSLVERQHDYGTCVYAMSMAAVAAFNYVAHKLGVTGFQASCADLDILRRTRHLEGPFMIIKGEDALYPQYDLPAKLHEALQEWKPWLCEKAKENLARKGQVHEDVRAHWEKLAAYQGKP